MNKTIKHISSFIFLLDICNVSKRIVFIITLFLCLEMTASAQCALCTKTAAGLDDISARGLNGGIIYLAAMPLAIIGLLGFKWFKHYKGTI